MNQLSIIGRLIKDPEIKFLQNDKVVATAALSVNRGNGKKDERGYPETDLFNVEVWGKSGEALANNLKKGDSMWAIGRVELKKVDDGKGYWVAVKDARWGFLPKPSAQGGQGNATSSSTAPAADDIDF